MSTTYPPFSVLMSVYAKDRPAWVAQALESVLSNTVKPTEVVIMVDGPVGADIQAVLNQAHQNPIVRILQHPVNVGRGAALAIALPQCRHELVALMDADDVSRPDRFEKQLSFLATHPEIAAVGGQIQEVSAEDFTPVALRRVPLTHPELRQYLKTRMPFNNVTVLFKKSAVLEAGGYQSFGTLEDYYMWVRVVAKGFLLANLPDILVDVRVNAAMYGRRGGWNCFHTNKLFYDRLIQLGLINRLEYFYILSIRFVVQVLMPNRVRSYFYKKVLR